MGYQERRYTLLDCDYDPEGVIAQACAFIMHHNDAEPLPGETNPKMAFVQAQIAYKGRKFDMNIEEARLDKDSDDVEY